ncbi:hypothetical protein PSI9734_01194 [Pseudidiomarina piscicola]|uniref:Uncharacterized protein n=1 Tax=Pseudidiomarina piscicola TaxID=2614830 RepID=A0A6S6WL19_9GAMM|nr:hypothetical protein [Pseudidiomarina piscicola]CAB0150753.1 hypothetical protein PSI9734_01194 [Pseudidiomarina piscicola]VZT40258.1 hypothetical protein PSI9734_01194 [Pseudomonas aeruginosa]
MSHPHNYSLETAPKAYLERVFISSRPRQITFAALIGPYRLHVLDITQHYTSLKAGNGEPFIAQAITSDRNGIHGVYGPIKHYLLIIDQQPVAVYDTDGRYISAADDEKPCPARASVHIG